MAYTIVSNHKPLFGLRDALIFRINVDGRFKVGRVELNEKDIRFYLIKLRQSKAYCGQHPGECIVGAFGGVQKKKNGTWLEWDDWVAFHDLINDVLDQYGIAADIYTKPQDARGKFYVRRGMKRRVKFDWEEEWTGGVFPRRIQKWNLGTPDQFEVDV